jgi:hypothetical protein
MQFLNGAKIEDFIDKDVHVIVTANSDACETLPLCRACILGDRMCIDLIPQLNRKYVVEVPDDALFSRNEDELSVGRYGILIPATSRAGMLILDLIEQKRRHQERRADTGRQ